MKVQSIVTVMVANGDIQMVDEVMEEVYRLNECGLNLEDSAVQFDVWLLESNGYKEKAWELREQDWEYVFFYLKYLQMRAKKEK